MPPADNTSREGRSQNRRVVFIAQIIKQKIVNGFLR